MKKSLLLSVVATGFIFAGGDIAPVAPVVQPQVAPAACDFWGQIGARYEFKDNGQDGGKFGDKENNTWKTTVVLGVEKEIGYGFGIGAELAATSQLGLNDIAAKTDETAELSELYLTYKSGNTAIKAGRQALPGTLSPWVWTDTTLGRKDITFEGVVLVNTDITDTTLVAAWVSRYNWDSNSEHINGVDNKGAFMVAVENKSIANTTLRSSIYYVTESKVTAAWASAETKAGSVDLGLQGAYINKSGTDNTFGIAAYAGTSFDAFDAKLTVAYINDGDLPLNPLGDTSGFWGNSFAGGFGGEAVSGNKQTIARIDFGYKIAGYGKIYGGIGMDKPDTGETAVGGRLGYKFKVSNVNAKIEYRYLKNKDFTDRKDQRIRVEGVYKF